MLAGDRVDMDKIYYLHIFNCHRANKRYLIKIIKKEGRKERRETELTSKGDRGHGRTTLDFLKLSSNNIII